MAAHSANPPVALAALLLAVEAGIEVRCAALRLRRWCFMDVRHVSEEKEVQVPAVQAGLACATGSGAVTKRTSLLGTGANPPGKFMYWRDDDGWPAHGTTMKPGP